MPPKSKPTVDPELAEVKRKGDVVTMPVATFDALITRLLLAETEQTRRSWWKP